jgi:preprotein translocase subunit YajC
VGGASRGEIHAVNRVWLIRIAGVLMLLMFMIIFVSMYQKLSNLQQQRQSAPAEQTST